MIKSLMTLLLLSFSTNLFAQEEEECEPDDREFTSSFNTDCRFITRASTFQRENPYFILEPGWQVVLEGEDDGEFIRVEITVLTDIEVVDGTRTRVVEEREYLDDELFEVSRNFYVMCSQTNDIYYFGEDVDFYEDGEIVDHHGAWRAGVDGAEPGIIMPGTIFLGARYYQEVAPGIAEDRAINEEIGELDIDGQVYEDVLFVVESSGLDVCDESEKAYAPGIGMIMDNELVLVEAGFIFEVPADLPFKR